MTRKHTELRPVLAVRPRPTADQSHGPGSFSTGNSDEYSTSTASSVLETCRNTFAPPLMYTFGGAIRDPAAYSRSPPLMPALHFTPDPQQEDEQMPEELLSKNISEELVNSGLYDKFPDEFATEDFVPEPRILETQEHDPYQMNLPIWSQQPSPMFHNQSLGQIAGYYQSMPLGSFHNTQPFVPSIPNPPPGKPSLGSQSRQRVLLPNVAGSQRHALPDTSDGNDRTNSPGRKRGLPPEARASASRVRIVGACGRCHVMKEKCDLERPCKPCSSKSKRILDFPCMRELPEERYLHLFTDGMYGHLELKDGAIFKKMPAPDRASLNKPFWLRLHQYFDDPQLVIPVVRFKPRAKIDMSKPVFPIASNGVDFEVQPMEILSPPLVPAMNQDNIVRYTEWFRKAVRRWLECAEYHEDLEWHNTFFREEYGKPWPRAVFAEICTFYHQVCKGGCPSLKSSLQSTVLAYMLGHSFYVPEEDIKSVLQETSLESEYNGGFMYVCPIYVDRFIKALLVQFFRATVKTALKHLQDLCSPNKHTRLSRDRILATSIVLLIVTGSQQSKAVEMAVARHSRGQEVNRREVYKQIKEIEEWINNMIMEIWLYKFRGNVRWEDDEPQDRGTAYRAKKFGLLEKFKQSYESFAGSLEDLSPELPDDINDRTFGINNLDRLLKKFYLCVFSPEQQKIPSSFEVHSIRRPKDRLLAMKETSALSRPLPTAKREHNED